MPRRATETQLALLERPRAGEAGSLARSGVRWTLFLIVVRQLTTLVTAAVLARLLAPKDFGIIGMTTTLTNLLYSVADLGLRQVVVQRATLSRAQSDNLFWINVAVGSVLWLLCVAVSSPLASFYAEDSLQSVLIVVGAAFFVGGLAAQPASLLTRQMRIRTKAIVEMAALLIGGVASVIVAVLLENYWALVAQVLVMQVVRLVGMFAVSQYRPGRWRRGADTTSLLKFGGYIALAGVAIFLGRNLDNVFVGRWLGAEELGYYTRAYSLMLLPLVLTVGSWNDVMTSTLSGQAHDRERMQATYLRVLGLIAFVGCPLSAALAVANDELVAILYGDGWARAASLLLWLSLGAIFQPIYSTTLWLFIAAGQGRAFFLWQSAGALIVGMGFAVGIRWGAMGVAVAFTVLSTAVVTPLSIHFSHRLIGFSVGRTVSVLVPVLASTAGMLAVGLAVGRYVDQLAVSSVVGAVLKLGAAGAAYAALTFILCREIWAQVVAGALVQGRRVRGSVRPAAP